MHIKCYQVNRVHQWYLNLVGLDYDTQVEMVKDFHEKEDDFVNILNVSNMIVLLFCGLRK